MNEVQLMFRLPKAWKERLQEIANEEDRSLASVARMAVRDFLASRERLVSDKGIAASQRAIGRVQDSIGKGEDDSSQAKKL